MYRILFCIVIFFVSSLFAGYDNTSIDIGVGGGGIITNSSAYSGFNNTYAVGVDNVTNINVTAGASGMYTDTSFPIRLPAGTFSISTVKCVVNRTDYIDQIWLGTFAWNAGNDTLTKRSTVEVTSQLASPRTSANTLLTFALTSGQLTAQNNDVVVVYIVAKTGTMTMRGHYQLENPFNTGKVYKFTGGTEWGSATAFDISDTADAWDTNQPLLLEVRIMASAGSSILFTSGAVDATNSGVYNIPWFVQTAAHQQWIMIEDIVVPDDEDLVFTFITCRVTNSSNYSIEKKVIIDFTGDTPYVQMQTSLGAGEVTTTTGIPCDIDLPEGDPDTYDLYIQFPCGSSGSLGWGVWCKNKTTGVGFQGGVGQGEYQDSQIIPVTFGDEFMNRTRESFGNHPPLKSAIPEIMSVKISQTTGEGATVGTITSCRWPVVALGDSIATIAYVGSILGSSFTETRYVIQAGVSGQEMSVTTSTQNSISRRWYNGIMFMPEVVVCLINGPSVNDMNRINGSTERMYSIPLEMVGNIAKIAAEAKRPNNTEDVLYFGGVNDVILSTMIPPNPLDVAETNPANFDSSYGYYSQEREGRLIANRMIRNIAYELDVPLADVSVYPYGFAGPAGRGVHPDTEGTAYIGRLMAYKYEHYTRTANPYNQGNPPLIGDNPTLYGLLLDFIYTNLTPQYAKL